MLNFLNLVTILHLCKRKVKRLSHIICGSANIKYVHIERMLKGKKATTHYQMVTLWLIATILKTDSTKYNPRFGTTKNNYF